MVIRIYLSSNGIHDNADIEIQRFDAHYLTLLTDISRLVEGFNKENLDKA